MAIDKNIVIKDIYLDMDSIKDGIAVLDTKLFWYEDFLRNLEPRLKEYGLNGIAEEVRMVLGDA